MAVGGDRHLSTADYPLLPELPSLLLRSLPHWS